MAISFLRCYGLYSHYRSTTFRVDNGPKVLNVHLIRIIITRAIVCAEDNLLPLIKVIYLIARGSKIKEFVSYLCSQRIENGLGERYAKIGILWYFIMTAFVLATLTQAVKIFGIQGIPGYRYWRLFSWL
jgi:hypothetical protein